MEAETLILSYHYRNNISQLTVYWVRETEHYAANTEVINQINNTSNLSCLRFL